ncbi:MAG: cytochrome b6-f complex iron-sulfur subunit [Saprospiraceae bacterium]|jgi:cytochrome b6-f complex iron-sulfur subunit
MKRRKFIKSCCYVGIGIPILGGILASCESLYYAQSTVKSNKLIVPLLEFTHVQKNKTSKRKFVLVQSDKLKFPICIYHLEKEVYVSSLLQCTHQGCELNVGGGIYSCPCHGAEFSTKGQVLSGPAENNLKTYLTTIENENIIVHLP